MVHETAAQMAARHEAEGRALQAAEDLAARPAAIAYELARKAERDAAMTAGRGLLDLLGGGDDG